MMHVYEVFNAMLLINEIVYALFDVIALVLCGMFMHDSIQ